ncbi:MAG TPA: protein kinase [Gemmatimonadaceae bacterium]|jgi:tetratricopeptide (TPR) repeat protein
MLQGLEELEEQLAGRYVIERELGRGGMATVYVARDLRHPRSVAIKVLRSELASSIAADRFRSEIGIATALSHPHIVPVFDSGGAGDRLFYVMPYIEGDTLRQRLKREGKLPVADALQLTREVADALAYAHGQGIIHRDIKPENILLVAGHAVVTDFGIARAIAQASEMRLTGTGISIGTPQYMSPEQAVGDSNVDARSDLYSLGCVLFEMLAGGPPHDGDTPREVIASKFQGRPKSVTALRPEVPPAIDQALAKVLAPDPAERYATAAEFGQALGRPSRTVRARQFVSTRPRWTVALGTLAVVAVAAVGAALLSARRSPVVASDGRLGIAILPFRATVPDAAQWTEAIPDLLATALDGTPGLRIADPWALWRGLRAKPNDAARSPDPAEGERLARQARACCYVLGSVAQFQPLVEVAIRIYRLGSSEPWSTFSLSGSPDSVPALVQRVSVELIRRLSVDRPGLVSSSVVHLTDSPEALKAWLRARDYQRRGLVDSADASITRALALDSNFALALVDASTIRSWLSFSRGQQYSGLRELAERAVRLSDSLPERQRLRARAMLASIETRGADAADALERILTLDSLDLQAWTHLGYVRNAYGWQYGATDKDARDAMEHALRLDSTDVPTVVNRAHLALATNNLVDVDRELDRVRRLDTTTGLARGTLLAIRAVRVDDAGFPSVAEAMTTAAPSDWIATYRVLRDYRPDRAELLSERTLRRTSAPVARIAAGALVQLYAAESRWQIVDSLMRARAFEQVAGFDQTVSRLTVAAAISGTADEDLARRAATVLEKGRSPDSALAQLERAPVWLEGWLIGAYEAMYGDTTRARRWMAAMNTLPKGGSPAEYAAALHADISSRLAARRGDRKTALAQARQAFSLWNIHTENQLELMPEPAIRFNLALLLRAEGDPRKAASLFRSLVPPTTWMGFYTPRAALELAELEEAEGDVVNARQHYLLALKTWEHGEDPISAYRDRARRGLARLGA